MRPHDNNTRPVRRPIRSKDLALQEREKDFQDRVGSDMVWDGESEPNPHRQIPSLPMKWHSNKWVARIFE